MSNRGQVNMKGDNAAPEREQPVGSPWNRRAVLGEAAGGFALAASGLLLPAWLGEEAEAADNHPARRILARKEGQRQKRRDRLEHRRKQQRRQDENQGDNDDKPEQGPYKNIEFRMEVSGGRPVFVHLYELYGCCWEDGDAKGTYAPGRSETFQADSRIAALQIDNTLWIKAINTLIPLQNPEVWLGYGGTFGERDDLNNGTTVAVSVLAVGSFSYKLERDGYAVQAIRREDTDRKVFTVKIVTPNA